jgi:hypothetical protein
LERLSADRWFGFDCEVLMIAIRDLAPLVRTAATTEAHWQRLFDALRQVIPSVDRICAALQVDGYTAYLARVAQPAKLDPILGRDGLFADREQSRTFDVIAEGAPYLVRDEDWMKFSDLAAYSVVMRSNIKIPVSFGGHPTVWNIWSRESGAFSPQHLRELSDLAVNLSQSPYVHCPIPVGLSLRRIRELAESRMRALAETNPETERRGAL